LNARVPNVAPASDENLSRERASYEERHIRVVGEKPEGKEGAISFKLGFKDTIYRVKHFNMKTRQSNDCRVLLNFPPLFDYSVTVSVVAVSATSLL
ncbi:MAG: hypothetical protein K2N18_02990, partial [Clostridia bacterium]|nr:hypothetical protein [Clostridia bacterium]